MQFSISRTAMNFDNSRIRKFNGTKSISIEINLEIVYSSEAGIAELLNLLLFAGVVVGGAP